jgi:integrase/recombinase XerD
MKQAKTLSESEIKVVLAVIAQGRNAGRNRTMLLMSHWAGMRVGEIAALRVGDVLDTNGDIKNEIRLRAEQTKGSQGRTVMMGDKLQKELRTYVTSLKSNDQQRPLFHSQKKHEGFSANTLCQQFGMFYRKAGIDGASSHSGRRTFITKLANKGVGVRVLMALAGHRNIGTTQRYIDLNDEMQRSAVNLI